MSVLLAKKRYAALVLVLILILLVAAVAVQLARVAPPAQGEASFDYLTDQARVLGFNPDRIVAFVRSEVRTETYAGVLRGALGTLWSRAGNDLDRSLLLQALLDRAHTPTRLVQGETYGVQTTDASRYLGPSRDADPGAKPVNTIGDDLYHTLKITVATVVNQTPITEDGGTYRVADLIGADMRLFYRKHNSAVVAVLEANGRERETTADAASAQRQEIILQIDGPGAAQTVRRRELFTAEFSDYPSFFHAENRYAFLTTAGWVPESVRAREAATASAWPNKTDGLSHLIGYTFLALSDANAQRVIAAKQVAARFVSPRITIVASEVDASSSNPTRSVSIDLRKNDLQIEGNKETQVAFATMRSIYDASLESVVLSQLTGMASVSGNELISEGYARRRATLVERQLVLRRALGRLYDERDEGASLVVSPEGKDGYTVQVKRHAGGLQVAVSESVRTGLSAAVAAGRATAQAIDLGILKSPDISSGQLDIATQEIEVALAVSANLPINYRQAVEFTPAPRAHWYADSRLFSYGGPKGELTYEQQFVSLEPDLRIQYVDYWDHEAQKFRDSPSSGTVTVAQADLEHARSFTFWNYDMAGRTIGMLSRDAYRELVSTGTTTLAYRDKDGNDGSPIQFWNLGPGIVRENIDSNRVEVKTFFVVGDYADRRTSKPTSPADVPDILDSDGAAINTFMVLEDPIFPLIVSNDTIQSAVSGRVIDSATGDGIADAQVTVREPGISATTWPDGRFVLPLIQQPYGTFSISVEAKDHKAVAAVRDFRQPDAFPLYFNLDRLPSADSWIPTSRSKKLIADATAEGRLVWIPTFPTYYPYGRTDAWIEIDPTTYEVYGRLVDGLYGATLHDLAPHVGPFGPPAPYAFQQGVINYYAGRIAGWYLFAAGSLDSLSLAISNGGLSMADFHKNAIERAREWARHYGDWGHKAAHSSFEGLEFAAEPSPPSAATNGAAAILYDQAFEKGLEDALEWADEFYKEAWGVK